MRVPVRLSDLPAAPRDSRTVAIYCRPHGAGTRPAPLQVFPAVAGDGTVTITGPGAVRGFRTGIDAPGGALGHVGDVVTSDNDADGFNVAGAGFAITSCEATRNGRDGFALRGLRYRVEGNRATENGRFGFSLAGRNATLGGTLGNEAAGNRRDGLLVRGRNHEVV